MNIHHSIHILSEWVKVFLSLQMEKQSSSVGEKLLLNIGKIIIL